MRMLKLVLLVGIMAMARGADIGCAPEVVTANCSGCHGLDGRAGLPYVPELAGQNEQYMLDRLKEFQSAPAPRVDELLFVFERHFTHTGKGWALMVGAARSTSTEDMQSAAHWYSKQLGGAGKPKAAGAAGASIYAAGSPSAGVAACQSCHGPNGHGQGSVPRLAGQHAAYLRDQLVSFRNGSRASSTMGTIAGKLDDTAIRAVVEYLEGQ